MMMVRTAMLFLLLAAAGASAQTPPPRRAVLVTGASSGIGRAVTEKLAGQGFFVYAGARSKEDIDALNRIANVQAVRLDVTVPAEIDAAVATVRKGGRGLYGIVNNAGVVVVAPLIEMTEQELDFIFDVNIYGAYRITRAFAPLLIESRGRVVNISSLNGIVANAMIGAYSMSKHAIEAYSDALAGELARLDVRVSIIEPGNFGTDIGRNLVARADTSRLRGSLFETQWRGTFNALANFASNPPPEPVANAVLDALSNETPRARYLVVPVAAQGAAVVRKLLQEIVQMNGSSAFPLERDAIVKMLDEELARSSGR
jgi:NAD(P)-dependent dehydrogenase (short-subunit alcohol dehydrogenase family)